MEKREREREREREMASQKKNRREKLSPRTDGYRHRRRERDRSLAREDEVQKSTWKVVIERRKLKMTT